MKKRDDSEFDNKLIELAGKIKERLSDSKTDLNDLSNKLFQYKNNINGIDFDMVLELMRPVYKKMYETNKDLNSDINNVISKIKLVQAGGSNKLLSEKQSIDYFHNSYIELRNILHSYYTDESYKLAKKYADYLSMNFRDLAFSLNIFSFQ
ncbi:hypothetical protein AYI69_g6792 [Smittium culicis]|uniref:Uncharacterized protein n=1 Tax=Smittium culicis TaxID=133412 RepID=A0A1R1XWG4_9FUNG|nr:hypothetical protein AYI69_g6792 [Smittium culicis]